MSKKEKRKVVTIRRSKWSAAQRLAKWNKAQAKAMGDKDEYCDVDPALLSSENGMKCCLGFVCQAVGVRVKDMVDVGMPSTLLGKLTSPLPEWLIDIENQAQTINDDGDITDRERESKLKKLFREKSPIDLKFVP